MAAVGAGPRRAGLGPVPRGRRDERRAALPAPRDGAADDAGSAFHEQWETALADLELEVRAAEDLLAHLHRDAEAAPAAPRRPWAPPTGLGPLPAPLADRARALAERQARTAEALGRAIVLNRRQARAAGALADARTPSRGDVQALYLDVAL